MAIRSLAVIAAAATAFAGRLTTERSLDLNTAAFPFPYNWTRFPTAWFAGLLLVSLRLCGFSILTSPKTFNSVSKCDQLGG